MTLQWSWNGGSNQSGICIPLSTNGTHTLQLFYQDSSGEWITYRFVYSIDLTPPKLLSEYPPNGSVFNRKDTHINFTFDELIFGAYYQWTMDGNWTEINCTAFNAL